MANVSPYCTSDDVVAAIPKVLRNPGLPNAVISETKITTECTVISAEMDSRFHSVGINVPVDTSTNERVQKNLQRIAVNGVCASLLKSISRVGESNFELAELFEVQYYRDIAFIEKNGLSFDESTVRGSAPNSGPKYDPSFTPSNDEGFKPDNVLNWGRW